MKPSFVVRLFLVHVVLAVGVSCGSDIENYRRQVDEWLDSVDEDLLRFNVISAKLSWDITIGNFDDGIQEQADDVIKARNTWKNRVCGSKLNGSWLNADERRKMYLLCRGPKFNEETAKKEMQVLNAMRACYQLDICFPEGTPTPLEELSTPGQNQTGYPRSGDCVMGEPDLEDLMKRTDLNAEQLEYVWTAWHDAVAVNMRKVFPAVVETQNLVARANGYSDMGEVWRDELETPNLEATVFRLYEQIEPLYRMLHAVVRHKLSLKYGSEVVSPTGSIPIHLLGNMWGQNWSPLLDLFVPSDEALDLDARLSKKNWTVLDMARNAEDFYTSMGLPKMTRKFWRRSVFEQSGNMSMCHGTAANMFTGDDFRMLLCAKVNMEDLYVIHHEMGHVEYNMAYRSQPAVYQDGTNSAFHETIGDVIMQGVMSPQHLYRLGLLGDDDLTDEGVDRQLLLRQALAKIAEVPFALVLDVYRWRVFDGRIDEGEYNAAYWELNERIRGVVPPERRGEEYLDAGAKFHVPDNTPFIRYFLSGILQMQVFKGLCELSLFGRYRKGGQINEETLDMPLHKCDIYGCKKCGKKLFEAMSLGASVHWTKVLEILTGKKELSTGPLLEYYAPIYAWLKDYVLTYDVPVGW